MRERKTESERVSLHVYRIRTALDDVLSFSRLLILLYLSNLIAVGF